MSDRAVEEFSQWDEMNAASDLSCGSLDSQQVSQASLGPVTGDFLDLSALDASIREDVETLSKSLSATSVHSRTADLDFMEPEATACGSPRAGAVRGSPRALLSRSSSAVSVYSGRADLDTAAVPLSPGKAALDFVGPDADNDRDSPRKLLSRPSSAVSVDSGRADFDMPSPVFVPPFSPQLSPVGRVRVHATSLSLGLTADSTSRKRAARVLPYQSPTPPLPSRLDGSPQAKRFRPLLMSGDEGGDGRSSLSRGSHSGVFAAASQQPRDELSGAGKLARARMGLDTDLAIISEAKRQKAIARLCTLLPEKALAHFLGLSTDRVAQMRDDAILQAAYSRARTRARGGKPLSPAAINEAANALSQLYLDLDARGIEHDGVNILPGDINDHLGRFVDSQAARKKDVDSSRGANSHSSARRSGDEGPSRLGTKRQTGFTSGRSRLRGLRHAAEWCGLNFGFDQNQVAVSAPIHVRRSQGIPAEPFTMGILLRLEAFCADDASDPVLAHVAAGMVFCALSCLRFEQAQHCWMTGVVGDEFIEGFVFQEKDPDPARMEPRPFWGLYQGLSHGDAWFRRWWSVIGTARQPTYVFQDVLIPPGGKLREYVRDSQGRPQWLSAPMEPGVRLISAVREVLVSVCGLSVEEAKAFGQHSARHFLPEAAKVSKEPGTCACEVGRWSGSVAKRHEARPTRDDLLDQHSTRLRRLPDLYAQANTAARPMVVLRRLRSRMLSAVTAMGGAHTFPLWGGWDALPQFRPVGDAFDD